MKTPKGPAVVSTQYRRSISTPRTDQGKLGTHSPKGGLMPHRHIPDLVRKKGA